MKDQLDQLLAIEYNSRTFLTLAPKFDKSANDHTVATDFIQGILALARAGSLELNSEFVRNTLNELTGIQPDAKGVTIRLTTARTPAEFCAATTVHVSPRGCITTRFKRKGVPDDEHI